MVRSFTQCKSVKERLEFMLSTNKEAWKENELNTIIEIIGLKVSAETSAEGKWAIIVNDLLLKVRAMEQEINANDKVFRDAEEKLAELNSLEAKSDLSAYLASCKKMDPNEAL